MIVVKADGAALLRGQSSTREPVAEVGFEREPADVAAGDLRSLAVKPAQLRLHPGIEGSDQGAHPRTSFQFFAEQRKGPEARPRRAGTPDPGDAAAAQKPPSRSNPPPSRIITSSIARP